MERAVLVQLQRPNVGQSWGFRLQGGRDFRQQLRVKKVTNGTSAHGQLQPGDVIAMIGNTHAESLTHMQAHQLIKSAGNVLQLTVIKGQEPGFQSIKPKGPVKFSPWRQTYHL